MPAISQHFTLNLLTISPLHIGSGRELLRDYDYAVHGGRTWRIDEDALLDAALGDGEFDDALLRRPAAELLQAGDFRAGSGLFRYSIEGEARSRQRGARVREQIKDLSDRPYLPGSSLKGALRTAVFDWALAHNPRALDTGRLRSSRKWAAQPLERAVLGRDPNHDLLRALQVADSDPVDPGSSLMLAHAQVLTGRQLGSPIEVEALRSEVVLNTTLKVDLSLFAPAAERQLGFGQRLDWLQDLMGVCRARAASLLEAERDWFARQRPGSPIANYYAQLHKYLDSLPASRCLLQVGWGGGWQGKTVGLRLDDRQREEVVDRYRLARGRRRRGDPFPKSRRVLMDGEGRPSAPLGWLLVEMVPEVAE
jgi:CRISPR-associated protein Csm5